MDYRTLDANDRLRIARDSLAAAETDHYRLSIRPQPNGEARLRTLEEDIESLAALVSDLEREADTDDAE